MSIDTARESACHSSRSAPALLALLATLLAHAPLPAQSTETLHACFVPGSGTVYRIAAPGSPGECLATDHVRFSWNLLSSAGGDLTGSYPNPVVSRLQGREIATTAPAEGQVLLFNGTAWVPASPPTGGVTQHGNLSGLTSDDHPQYLLADGSRALAGNLSAAGFRITNLAAANAAGQAVRFEQAVKSGDVAGGDLAGSYPTPTVAGLRGRSVAATAPAQGQVLTWNGAAWAPAAAPGGVTAHGQLSGLTDDDHPLYLLAGGVRNAADGFAVTGTQGSGNLLASGAGVRLLWYPGRGAFRVGQVNGTQWDDSNIGVNSVALGLNTTGSGARSTALGWNTIASGGTSTALGTSTTASGISSTALGINTRASGRGALAMGNNTTASGDESVAAGVNGTASGLRAVAMGRHPTASGENSVAFGDQTAATSHNTTALGRNTTASGFSSLATGENTTASGNYTTAMGFYASTDGRRGSFVYGDVSSLTVIRATRDDQFVVRAQHFWLGTNNSVSNPAGHFLTTSTGAHLTTGGAWTNSSDASRKEHFETMDAEQVLERLAALPVRSWSYVDEANVRHVGPTAQDFHAAFSLGGSETAIATVDADGINMLAIQALERRTRELREKTEELEGLRQEVTALRAELTRLEALVQQLVR